MRDGGRWMLHGDWCSGCIATSSNLGFRVNGYRGWILAGGGGDGISDVHASEFAVVWYSSSVLLIACNHKANKHHFYPHA